MADWLRGTFTATVTPFGDDGSLDVATLARLVERQIEAGVDGIVPCGTTGESVTLERREHLRVVEQVVDTVAGRARVVAGAGGSATAAIAALAGDVARAGADAILSVVPAYNKPNQEGLYRHFSTIADACSAPVVLYNVPGRTARDMTTDTVARLADHGNVIGIKESSGSTARIDDIVRAVPDHFSVLSGDDDQALPAIFLGARGLVSVAANEAPGLVSAMVRAALDGRIAEARAFHRRLLPLFRANFVDTNPIPVKVAMHHLGLIRPHLRLPLVWADTDVTQAVLEAMESAGITPSDT